MKKFFIFFIITIMITSCVPNKKIFSPEQLTQDKILAEKILGSWNLYPSKGGLFEIDFYKNNTSLWQTTQWNYALQSEDLIKLNFNWKIEDRKIKFSLTKINVFSRLLGNHSIFNILEFSDDRITLKDQNGNKVLMIRRSPGDSLWTSPRHPLNPNVII